MSPCTCQLTISQRVIKHLEARASPLFSSVHSVIASIHFNPPPAIDVLFTNVSYSYKPIISVTICLGGGCAYTNLPSLYHKFCRRDGMELQCFVIPSMSWEPLQHCWRERSFMTRYSAALLVFVGLHLLGAVAALLPARTTKNTDALLVLIGLLIAYPYKCSSILLFPFLICHC